eukprot:symbB.v1.2.001399.t1/scaffold75.1/size348941/5
MRVAVRSRYTNINGGYEEHGKHNGRPAFRRTTGDAWIFYQEGLNKGTWHFGPALPTSRGAAVHFSSLDDGVTVGTPVAAAWPPDCVEKVWEAKTKSVSDLKGLWMDKEFPPNPKSIGNVSVKAEWVPVRQLREGNWKLFDVSNTYPRPGEIAKPAGLEDTVLFWSSSFGQETSPGARGSSQRRNPHAEKHAGRIGPMLYTLRPLQQRFLIGGPYSWRLAHFANLTTGTSSSSTTSSSLLRQYAAADPEDLDVHQRLELLCRLPEVEPSIHDLRLQRLAQEVVAERHDLPLTSLVDAAQALHQLGLKEELRPLVSMATESAAFLSGDVVLSFARTG